MTPTYGSLFSGAGGFDLGFDAAGWQCAWQVEIDATCQTVLRRHWPDVPKHTDVRTVGAHNLAPVDCIIGGWPCQDHSVAGKRAGFDGTRSSLFHEFARIVAELRPRWVCAENVPGLLSQRDEFAYVIGRFDGLGYVGCWRVLDAQFFGVPQRRRRVFIVASAGDGNPAAVLFESESVRRDSPPSRTAGQIVAGTLGGGAGSRGWSGDTDRMTFIAQERPLSGAVSAKWAKGTGGPAGDECYNLVASPVLANAGRTYDDAGSHGHGVRNLIASPLTASNGHHGHSSPRGDGADNLIASTLRAGESRFNPGSPRADGSDNQVVAAIGVDNHAGAVSDSAATLRATEHGALPMVFTERGRADGRNVETQTDLAFAVRDGSNGSGSHLQLLQAGYAVRRLTPLECERLQGWPDQWTRWRDDGTEIADSHRYRMVGNGVASSVAAWIAARMRKQVRP